MKKLLVIGFLLAISLPVIWPFLRSGYFPTHDGEWAVVRLAEMHREIKDFQFPPRWAGFLNHGFGYPLFLFSYPLPYYLGEVVHLLGPGIVNSVKLVFILSVFLSALTMFLLGRKLWGNLAGLIAAVFYLYLPFRMVDLYVRGSIGESLAFIFYPLLFWLGLNLLEKRTGMWVVFAAAALAGLILTHNVMALMFIPFWFAFMIVWSFKTKGSLNTYYLILTTFLGFFLSAFFWLPALLEKKYVLLGQMPIANLWENFVSLPKLLLPSWGYGLPNQPDAFSFQIGWVHLLGFVLGLLAIRKQTVMVLFSFFSFLLLTILMFPVAYPFWHYVPLFSTIDFPWRLLGIMGFFVSLTAGGLIVSGLGKKLAVVLSVLVIIVNLGYAKPLAVINKGDDYYRTNDATTTSFDELMPTSVKVKPREKPREKVSGANPQIEVKLAGLTYNSKEISFLAEAGKNTDLKINTIYFPGWQAFIDGQKQEIKYDNQSGLMTVALPAGEHTVDLKWQSTPVRRIADLISLVSLITVIFLFFPMIRFKKARK